MRVIEKLYGAEKLPFGIFENSEMVGVFPLFRVRRGPLTILASPLGGVGYGGPLVNRSHYRIVIEHLDDWCKRLGADYVEFRALGPSAPATLNSRHYTVQELQTAVLPLSQGPQKLWSNLKGACRTKIRKAWKENVKVEEATDKSFLDVYYAMATDTYGKSDRLPPYSTQDYGTVWDILRPEDRIKVLLAKYEGQVVAGGIFLCFDDKICYWDGASFPAYYRLMPNNLLHWTLIEWAASNGLAEYDMLGANIPSIARFKMSFGGELRTYIYAYKDATLPAYVGRRLYGWLLPRIRRMRFRLRPA
jgi:hypothetical protein